MVSPANTQLQQFRAETCPRSYAEVQILVLSTVSQENPQRISRITLLLLQKLGFGENPHFILSLTCTLAGSSDSELLETHRHMHGFHMQLKLVYMTILTLL